MTQQSAVGPRAGCILELDRDQGIYPGYFAAVLIRPSVSQIRNTRQVRGTLSQILKGDYRANPQGKHTVLVQSDGSNQQGTIYTLYRI